MKIVINTNREIRDLETEREIPTLQELQKVVGGLIELVYLRDGNIMVINEEGKLTNDLDVNEFSTVIAFPDGGDIVFGNAVILSPDMME